MSEKSKRNSNINLKEKIVCNYDLLLQAKNPLDCDRGFWDEFFLIKCNGDALEQMYKALNSEQLVAAQENITELFCRSVDSLEDHHGIATVNAIQTLTSLVKAAYRKSTGDSAYQLIKLLIGYDDLDGDRKIQELIVNMQRILSDEKAVPSLKNLCLRFLLTLITLTEHVSQNSLLEYLMVNNIFEALLQILSDSKSRLLHGSDAVILLTLLVQYQKHETTNPYTVNLSILADDLALNGLSKIILLSLLDYNREFREKLAEQKPSGFIASVASMVGSVFGGDDLPKVKIKPDLAMLLSFYETIHLNRSFVTAMTTIHASAAVHSGSLPSLMDLTEPAVPGACEVKALKAPDEMEHPTNLLATFIEYASIVTIDVKDAENLVIARLCFLILTLIAEDQYANLSMHDQLINFSIPIHKSPMRHRKAGNEKIIPSQTIAASVIDLQVEFIQSHMMKTIPAELYLLSLGILHRIMCYQKKTQTRLSYPWKHLWTALISLCKFLQSNESMLLKICNLFHIAIKAVGLFNMFITFGDSFLATLNSYDELYYEIIRNHQVFDNLHTLAMRHSSGSSKYKEDAARLIHCLSNIRSVINHFNPKVDSWASVNHLSSLTEDQVLTVVRENYETLTLKMHDGLDHFDKYCERPKESNFFTNVVRKIVQVIRQRASTTKLEQTRLIQEFTSIVPADGQSETRD